jgi:hypothetical protein
MTVTYLILQALICSLLNWTYENSKLFPFACLELISCLHFHYHQFNGSHHTSYLDDCQNSPAFPSLPFFLIEVTFILLKYTLDQVIFLFNGISLPIELNLPSFKWLTRPSTISQLLSYHSVIILSCKSLFNCDFFSLLPDLLFPAS